MSSRPALASSSSSTHQHGAGLICDEGCELRHVLTAVARQQWPGNSAEPQQRPAQQDR